MTKAQQFVEKLNEEYLRVHTAYEQLFWLSYMGDHAKDAKRNKAEAALDAFRADEGNLRDARLYYKSADAVTRKRLEIWIRFFELYQAPKEALRLKEQIIALESRIKTERTTRTEGYLDPYTGAFVPASMIRMRTLIATQSDERVRRACFEARERYAEEHLDAYVTLVRLRNEYARTMGYDDFYDYKLRHEERMTKAELFSLFDSVYQKTAASFMEMRALEKKHPGLRKPWNMAYVMAGDFTKEEDPYFQFEHALERWAVTFTALGVNLRGATLTLDLLDRAGKWNNGFIHAPVPPHYEHGRCVPGAVNFTCNLVPGQVGAGARAMHTLFHEGGHAAHFVNMAEREVVLNQEYAPMTASWSETHSMFMDTIFDSIEWRVRYARTAEGEAYPFELFAKKERKLAALRAQRIHSVMFVCDFERQIYEAASLTPQKVRALARKMARKYFDYSADTLSVLNIPHIYGWQSACDYHGYGLAMLAVAQWREYFEKKYGFIVDNPGIGKEMQAVWKLGSRYPFTECVKRATGKKLSAAAFLRDALMPTERMLTKAQNNIALLSKAAPPKKKPGLNATIRLVDGKKTIATNAHGFDAMTQAYARWLRKHAKTKDA